MDIFQLFFSILLIICFTFWFSFARSQEIRDKTIYDFFKYTQPIIISIVTSSSIIRLIQDVTNVLNGNKPHNIQEESAYIVQGTEAICIPYTFRDVKYCVYLPYSRKEAKSSMKTYSLKGEFKEQLNINQGVSPRPTKNLLCVDSIINEEQDTEEF